MNNEISSKRSLQKEMPTVHKLAKYLGLENFIEIFYNSDVFFISCEKEYLKAIRAQIAEMPKGVTEMHQARSNSFNQEYIKHLNAAKDELTHVVSSWKKEDIKEIQALSISSKCQDKIKDNREFKDLIYQEYIDKNHAQDLLKIEADVQKVYMKEGFLGLIDMLQKHIDIMIKDRHLAAEKRTEKIDSSSSSSDVAIVSKRWRYVGKWIIAIILILVCIKWAKCILFRLVIREVRRWIAIERAECLLTTMPDGPHEIPEAV